MRINISTKKHPNVFAEIDDDDFASIAHIRWAATLRRKKLYVRGWTQGRSILLHRYLMGDPESMLIDHKDGDPLNNRRGNLRECTIAQNTQFALENGAFDHLRRAEGSIQVHTVKRKLADGTVRIHRYNRQTRERLGNDEA
jgi:hypothetical protein